jgi:hypothetical protein
VQAGLAVVVVVVVAAVWGVAVRGVVVAVVVVLLLVLVDGPCQQTAASPSGRCASAGAPTTAAGARWAAAGPLLPTPRCSWAPGDRMSPPGPQGVLLRLGHSLRTRGHGGSEVELHVLVACVCESLASI